MVEYSTEVLRYDDVDSFGPFSQSERGELNSAFADRLKSHQIEYGGGGCTSEWDYPIEGPVTLYLTAYIGSEPPEGGANTATVTLDEGDSATIGIQDDEYRIKYYGHYMSRSKSDQVINKQSIAFAVDKWDEEEELWIEIDQYTGTSDTFSETYDGNTIRVVIADAPGYDPEKEFRVLAQKGLTPAEILDYWMTEIRHSPQEEWAETRGKTQQAISKNANEAKAKIANVAETSEE